MSKTSPAPTIPKPATMNGNIISIVIEQKDSLSSYFKGDPQRFTDTIIMTKVNQTVKLFHFIVYLVEDSHDDKGLRHPGAGREEVEEQGEVPVVVVNVVQLSQ